MTKTICAPKKLLSAHNRRARYWERTSDINLVWRVDKLAVKLIYGHVAH